MSLKNLRPHPLGLSERFLTSNPIMMVGWLDNDWLKAAGYGDMERFIKFYGFDDSNHEGIRKAERLFRSFRQYPLREHPVLLPHYEGEPNLNSDAEWLASAGYINFKAFADWYELEEGPAKKLLLAFRDNHQMKWIEMNGNVNEKPSKDMNKWKGRSRDEE